MTGRAIQALKFGDDIIYMEVSDVEQQEQLPQEQAQNRLQPVNAANTMQEIRDAGSQIHSTVRGLCTTIQNALKESQPEEWAIEINLGIKGSAGIPFVTQGEANGAVKITAKWKKS